MSQVSPFLRRKTDGYVHWCPACEQMHSLPDSWNFNGDLNKPTFNPSFKTFGHQLELDAGGNWTGKWKLDAQGKPIPYTCHYILTNGILNFCGDCTHSMAGKSVPLPELPTGYKD
jgi:hypothetical protein